jgi:hypothetical protein
LRQPIDLHPSTHFSIATDEIVSATSFNLQAWGQTERITHGKEMSVKTAQQNLNSEVRELTALERAAVSGGRIYWESEEALKAAPSKPPGILSGDHNI